MKFRTKPRVIDAEQFFPDRHPWPPHVHHHGRDDAGVDYYSVRTLSGRVQVEAGDWIAVDAAGAPYPTKPAVFDVTYEPVSAANGNE